MILGESRSCGSLVALLPGTNFEGQSVEMKEPKNGYWTINAGVGGHPSLSRWDGEFYDWAIKELSNRSLCSLSSWPVRKLTPVSCAWGEDRMFAFFVRTVYNRHFDPGNARI